MVSFANVSSDSRLSPLLRSRQGTLPASCWIVSSKEAVEVLLHPELVGAKLIGLVQAVATRTVEWIASQSGPELVDATCSIIPLRGGELYRRNRDGRTRSRVRFYSEGQLDRELPGGTRRIIVGDTVATGRTICGMLDGLLVQGKAIESVREFVVHGFIAVEGIAAIAQQLATLNMGISLQIIGYEGLFHLPTLDLQKERPVFGRQDFLRRGSIMSGAYVSEQAGRPDLALEKCSIYDTGDRAFAPHVHNEVRRGHYRYLAKLSEEELLVEGLERHGVCLAVEELVLGRARIGESLLR